MKAAAGLFVAVLFVICALLAGYVRSENTGDPNAFYRVSIGILAAGLIVAVTALAVAV